MAEKLLLQLLVHTFAHHQKVVCSRQVYTAVVVVGVGESAAVPTGKSIFWDIGTATTVHTAVVVNGSIDAQRVASSSLFDAVGVSCSQE